MFSPKGMHASSWGEERTLSYFNANGRESARMFTNEGRLVWIRGTFVNIRVSSSGLLFHDDRFCANNQIQNSGLSYVRVQESWATPG